MMCPFCGKLGQDSRAICMYCGVIIPNHSSGPGNSAIIGVGDQPYSETTCYETFDITGCEWRDDSDSDNVRPEHSEAGCVPLEVFDVSAFNGTEWRLKCSQQPVEAARTPLISSCVRESGISLVSVHLDGNNALASPYRDGDPPSRQADLPRNDEEQLRAVLQDDYTILRKLGAGGMASVYLARETALNREVAIKVLPQAFRGDVQFSARFRREARLSAMLEHPHIVRIYRIGEEPDLCYFTMNYIPGGALADRMRNGLIVPTREIVRWGADVCSALAYAHDHGVIHRDLKPDNIMLDHRNRAVVTDFGIAYALREVSLTQTGAVIGTPQYMSPDQARGKIPDARSDIYSLGMVLYQMAAGTLPFRASDPVALMYMHVHQAPQSPETFNPGIPRWLRDIILRCLAKKPSDRFPDAVQLRLALINGAAGNYAPDKLKPENERGIHSIIGAAVHLVSSAVSGLLGKESLLPPAVLHIGRHGHEQPRHCLKLPRNMDQS